MADPTAPERPKRPFQLAIVGASARAAAQSAASAGFEVAAADLFADADLQLICPVARIEPYPARLLSWLAGAHCDGWMYVGALENHAELIGQLAATRPLLGNGPETLRAVRNPLRLQETLRDNGFAFPETMLATDRPPGSGCWLSKTYQGSSGAGVADASRRDCSLGGYWQRRVDGVPASAMFVADGATAQCVGIARQLIGESWTGAKTYQYCGAIAPLAVARAVADEVIRLGDVLAQAFGLLGVFGVDLMIDDHTIWVLEVNPRFTASAELFERIGSESVVGAHIAACRQRKLRGHSERRCVWTRVADRFVGKAILFAQRSCRISRSAAALLLAGSRERSPALVADLPTAGANVEPGQPILTMFADGASPEEVRGRLESELEHCRCVLYEGRPTLFARDLSAP